MHLVYLPNLHPQNSIDIGLLCVSATSLDHVISAKETPHISDEIVGMDAFTSITLDKSLTKERVQTQLATKVQSLVCTSTVISLLSNMSTQVRYVESIGLDLSVFSPSNYPSRISSIMSPL